MAPLDFNAPTPEQKAEIKRRKAAITRRVRREVLAKYGLDRLPHDGARVLVTGAQGSGKSKTVAEAIAEEPLSDAIWWWLTPTLTKAEEQLDDYRRLAHPHSPPAMVVRGRGAPDPATADQAMCPRCGVVNRAAAMGVNVQETICDNGCPLRCSCGFQRQKQQIKRAPPSLFIMAADYLWLPCPAPKPDIVIADESLLDKAAEVLSFDPTRIVDDSMWAGGELDAALERRRIALLVRAAVSGHPGRELEFLRAHGVTGDDLKACMEHLFTRPEAHPALSGTMPDRAIAAALDAVEAREVIKVMRLFRQIRRELPRPRRRLNSIWFEPDARVRVGGEVERQPRVFVGYVKTPRIARTVPVLCLDGTGSLSLNQKIFGPQMTGERFAVPRDAEVIQVDSRAFSRQSLTGAGHHGVPLSAQKLAAAERLRAQVVELVSMIPGNVLLVSYKPVVELLAPVLPAHVRTAHFGALRGLNSFEDCETAVVIGREQPSAQAVEALTRPFCATDDEPFLPVGEYAHQSRGRRMRNGGANVVEVQVHPDLRCQELLEQVREAEIVQAVDRVRPVFNRRRIFVLTSVPVDLTVDLAAPWPAVRPSRFAHAFARHGLLPLGAADLAAAFPDLWPSENSAKVELSRSGLNGYKLPIKNLLAVCTHLPGDLLEARYRRKGQCGKASRALIDPRLSEPCAALEGLLGELMEFSIAHPPEPAASAEAATPAAKPLSAAASASPYGPAPALPPMVAAMAAEAHLLATLSPDGRPPDMLGMARVIKLMALAAGPERAAAA